MSDEFSFEFDMAGVDRRALLEAAAGKVDVALSVDLGCAGGSDAATKEGQLTRAMMEDQARLPAYPDVYRISDQDFLARGQPVGVRFAELTKRFNFYWLRFPVGLRPEMHWGFNMLEVRVEFNQGAEPHLRPKAYQVLPEKKFQTLARANMSLELGLNEALEFEVKKEDLQLQGGALAGKASAKVGAVANAGAGAVFGPFVYAIKKAKINHSAAGLEWVFWRLDGAEFFEEDAPELVVVLQVPKGVKAVSVKAELQASRYFNLGAAPWQKAIAQIPSLLADFFRCGMPIRDEKAWDLTPSL